MLPTQFKHARSVIQSTEEGSAWLHFQKERSIMAASVYMMTCFLSNAPHCHQFTLLLMIDLMAASNSWVLLKSTVTTCGRPMVISMYGCCDDTCRRWEHRNTFNSLTFSAKANSAKKKKWVHWRHKCCLFQCNLTREAFYLPYIFGFGSYTAHPLWPATAGHFIIF